ncbi:SDR family NAD(P)-dependent oxidoreductase [Spirochaeta africana]|uniref:Short-chain dehydrogenase n=1 Tax=Spirochaeta africana (strain ATCC 700263 / DSM 8902 / Z-7692) TaxID=889378 RepID=H9UG30_SPIAZ|nr:SDR family NAD(P)-dependent oxidoreductase [Spirochaeta africana]AFG36473.1 short-chain dehydrogenase of unknown substrate specificity [Spirochaeta africana DSM 8902]
MNHRSPHIRQFAVVTGASAGLGRALAVEAASRGYRCILIARSSEGLHATADTIRASAPAGHWADCPVVLPLDLLSDSTAAADAILDACRLAGGHDRTGEPSIGLLINNAGMATQGVFAASPPAAVAAQLQLNLCTAVLLTRLLLPYIPAGGRILNISSTAGLCPGPGMAVYYATKAGLTSWSRALAVELRMRPVTVTTFCPGPLRTGFVAKAGVENRGYLRSAPTAEAAAAAAMRRAMGAGGMLVYPGRFRLLAALQHLVPQRLAIALVYREQRRRGVQFEQTAAPGGAGVV